MSTTVSRATPASSREGSTMTSTVRPGARRRCAPERRAALWVFLLIGAGLLALVIGFLMSLPGPAHAPPVGVPGSTPHFPPPPRYAGGGVS